MNNKYSKIRRIIFPSKKINYFIIFILLLGIVAGSLFACFINFNDKNLVIDKIRLFVDNINNNSINNIQILKNSLSINYTYIVIIWILGMTIIGILFNIFLLFIKGFIFSFSVSSFIITYGLKGTVLSFLYLLFGQLLNIIVIIILGIYSMMFSIKLLKLIVKKNNNIDINKFLKNYFIILVVILVISFISSLSEAFFLPSLIKLFIKLFI